MRTSGTLRQGALNRMYAGPAKYKTLIGQNYQFVKSAPFSSANRSQTFVALAIE